MTYSETINYNALIEVDAMSSVTVSGELKWAELDVMIFDGEIRYDEDLVLRCRCAWSTTPCHFWATPRRRERERRQHERHPVGKADVSRHYR